MSSAFWSKDNVERSVEVSDFILFVSLCRSIWKSKSFKVASRFSRKHHFLLNIKQKSYFQNRKIVFVPSLSKMKTSLHIIRDEIVTA